MIDFVTRDNLNATMEFDTVIEVHDDGQVTAAPSNVWAPEVTMSETDPRNPTVHDMAGDRWELLNGYSGQYLYSGPIMHASEYIGGRMADDILSTPGLYAAVVVTVEDAGADEGNDDGWAVVRKVMMPAVPDDFPVKVVKIGESATAPMTCGECGRTWDDAIATGWTPTPAARCPFEYFH